MLLLLRVLDVCIDEQAVHLGVDVLHHDLKAIEAASFGYLYFTAEAFEEVLIDNTVGGGKEGKNVRDEVSLVVIKTIVPVLHVL